MSATALEVTRDLVVALLANDKSRASLGNPDEAAKQVAETFSTIYDTVRAKNNS